jgi:hypothetical protein
LSSVAKWGLSLIGVLVTGQAATLVVVVSLHDTAMQRFDRVEGNFDRVEDKLDHNGSAISNGNTTVLGLLGDASDEEGATMRALGDGLSLLNERIRDIEVSIYDMKRSHGGTRRYVDAIKARFRQVLRDDPKFEKILATFDSHCADIDALLLDVQQLDTAKYEQLNKFVKEAKEACYTRNRDFKNKVNDARNKLNEIIPTRK